MKAKFTKILKTVGFSAAVIFILFIVAIFAFAIVPFLFKIAMKIVIGFVVVVFIAFLAAVVFVGWKLVKWFKR